MNILFSLYNELIYRPLFNLLIYLYDVVPGHDIGVAIIVLTVLVRLVLYRMNGKAIKSQREMQEIQPLIKEIQQKYRDDREKQAQELMAIYREHKINPFSGCLPMLVQLPIIMALYWVFLNGFKDASLGILYPFVPNPGHLNTLSFGGLVDLGKPAIVLALLAAVLQYYQTNALMRVAGQKKAAVPAVTEKSPEEKMQEFTESLTKNMTYTMPVVTFVFALGLPSGLALYWSVTTLFAIIQQSLIMRKRKKTA